jgi:hypothetical protein
MLSDNFSPSGGVALRVHNACAIAAPKLKAESKITPMML